MKTQAELAERRLAYATAVYGALSIALVVVDWEGDGNEWHLVEVIAGYVATLWLTHTYASLVSRADYGSWFEVAREEFSVAAAGLPALGVAIVGKLLGFTPEAVADIALLACFFTLIGIQTAIVRLHGLNRRRVMLTIVVDMILAAVILTLHVTI